MERSANDTIGQKEQSAISSLAGLGLRPDAVLFGKLGWIHGSLPELVEASLSFPKPSMNLGILCLSDHMGQAAGEVRAHDA